MKGVCQLVIAFDTTCVAEKYLFNIQFRTDKWQHDFGYQERFQ